MIVLNSKNYFKVLTNYALNLIILKLYNLWINNVFGTIYEAIKNLLNKLDLSKTLNCFLELKTVLTNKEVKRKTIREIKFC